MLKGWPVASYLMIAVRWSVSQDPAQPARPKHSRAEPEGTAKQLVAQLCRSLEHERFLARCRGRPFPGLSSVQAGGAPLSSRSAGALHQLLHSERLTQPRDHVIIIEEPHWCVLPTHTRGTLGQSRPSRPPPTPHSYAAPCLPCGGGDLCTARALICAQRVRLSSFRP